LPAAGDTFPIGTTTVTCIATDTHGNTATATFNVHVEGAVEQLADLRVAVTGVGPGTSLADKVSQAQTFLAASNVAGACTTLDAFIHEVKAQSGTSLSTDKADTLTATAQRIEIVLSC
jgi:HYR domain